MIWISLLSAIALSPSSQQPVELEGKGTPDDYVLRELGFAHAGLIDGLCIVEAKGRVGEKRRGSENSSNSTSDFVKDIFIEKTVVVDGPNKGSARNLVTFDDAWKIGPNGGGGAGIWVTTRPSFVVGKRYLALCSKPVDGKLYQPFNLFEAKFQREGRMVYADQANELSLLNAFPTAETHLPPINDPAQRLINALIDTLPETHGWNRERLVHFLRSSNGFGFDSTKNSEDTDLTKRMREMAQKTSDLSLRADIYSILVSWRVLGSEGPMFSALMDMANDTTYKRDLPDPRFVRPGQYGEPAVGYSITFDHKRANNLASAASNEIVRHFLFEYGISHPSRADMASYVRMLDTEDKSFVDYIVLRTLASWEHLEDKRPIWGIPPGKKLQEVVNRDELITFWKKRYPL